MAGSKRKRKKDVVPKDVRRAREKQRHREELLQAVKESGGDPAKAAEKVIGGVAMSKLRSHGIDLNTPG